MVGVARSVRCVFHTRRAKYRSPYVFINQPDDELDSQAAMGKMFLDQKRLGPKYYFFRLLTFQHLLGGRQCLTQLSPIVLVKF
jgi:hypothetical protein